MAEAHAAVKAVCASVAEATGLIPDTDLARHAQLLCTAADREQIGSELVVVAKKLIEAGARPLADQLIVLAAIAWGDERAATLPIPRAARSKADAPLRAPKRDPRKGVGGGPLARLHAEARLDGEDE